MFAQLLEEIRSGGTLEVNALAAKLNTTPELITAMLDHMQRLGLIEAYASCADGCQGCTLSDACTRKEAVHLWQSTAEN